MSVRKKEARWHMSIDPKILSRTPKTIAQYEGIFARFMRLGLERSLQPVVLQPAPSSDVAWSVEVFLERRVEWSKATERSYRAAMIYALDSAISEGKPYYDDAKRKLLGMTDPIRDPLKHFQSDEEQAKAITALAEMQKKRKEALDERRRSRTAGKTSTQKAKKLSPSDIEAVVQRLDLSRSKWKNDTKEWFLAGILTGLRPSEWAQASLNDAGTKLMLVVKNGKNTNGRSFGEHRELDISELNRDEKLLIGRHIERANSHQERQNFEAWYNRCRKLMHTISRVMPSTRTTHPTLYSARHRFAATAKAQLSHREVAALMGHGSETTAAVHYARRDSSNGQTRVKPSQRSVQALADRNGQEPKIIVFPKKERAKSDASKISNALKALEAVKAAIALTENPPRSSRKPAM